MSFRSLCEKLAGKYGASVLTDIFQGQSPKSIGSGVCRAVVAHWIASNIQASSTGEQELASAFRSKAEVLKTGETAESFIVHQSDYDFHMKAFHRARLEYRETRKEQDEWSTKLESDKSQGTYARWQVAVKTSDKAYKKAMKLAQSAELYKTMFTAPIKETSEGKFSNLVALLVYKMVKPGFYFISIGPNASKHALGFYTCHKLDSCVFIDPNSCEWVLPSLDAASQFLAEYVKAIKLYSSWMNEVCKLDYIGESMLYEPLP